MGSGDGFGELTPLTRGVGTDSVRTPTEYTLAVIDGQQLCEMLEMGSLCGRFVSTLIERLINSQLTENSELEALHSSLQSTRYSLDTEAGLLIIQSCRAARR